MDGERQAVAKLLPEDNAIRTGIKMSVRGFPEGNEAGEHQGSAHNRAQGNSCQQMSVSAWMHSERKLWVEKGCKVKNIHAWVKMRALVYGNAFTFERRVFDML